AAKNIIIVDQPSSADRFGSRWEGSFHLAHIAAQHRHRDHDTQFLCADIISKFEAGNISQTDFVGSLLIQDQTELLDRACAHPKILPAHGEYGNAQRKRVYASLQIESHFFHALYGRWGLIMVCYTGRVFRFLDRKSVV